MTRVALLLAFLTNCAAGSDGLTFVPQDAAVDAQAAGGETMDAGDPADTLDAMPPTSCIRDRECADPATPLCIGGVCASCVASPLPDSACETKDPATSLCRTDGRCVSCLDHSDCMRGTAPLCSDGQCSTCTATSCVLAGVDLLQEFAPPSCAEDHWDGYRIPPRTCLKIKGANGNQANFFETDLSSHPGECGTSGGFHCLVVGAGAAPVCFTADSAKYCSEDMPVAIVKKYLPSSYDFAVERFDFVDGACPVTCSTADGGPIF